MTASTGRHWRTEVIPAVRHDVGVFSGVLPVESLLEQTAPLLPFDQPTVVFDRAQFEFGLRLDRQIAAARMVEQRRLVAEQARATAATPWWKRACRAVAEWLVTR